MRLWQWTCIEDPLSVFHAVSRRGRGSANAVVELYVFLRLRFGVGEVWEFCRGDLF